MATGRACTSPEPLGHGDYGAPVTWYKSATPLVACGHQVNVVLVVPQCVDGTAVYWDAQTGTTLLQQSDYAATCSSPCLTFQTDVYYRSGETEVQTVYNSSKRRDGSNLHTWYPTPHAVQNLQHTLPSNVVLPTHTCLQMSRAAQP